MERRSSRLGGPITRTVSVLCALTAALGSYIGEAAGGESSDEETSQRVDTASVVRATYRNISGTEIPDLGQLIEDPQA